ncbi:MAG TPA: hypothetical protein VFQ53_40380 [Kofleriaceae bacterium]|nr:hypothetical protein [Kofleriaceae bacterium]
MIGRICLAITFVVVCVCGFGIAHADRSPDMATLDRGDGITKIGVDFGLSILNDPPYDSALRIEPYGQYVLRSGLGFYAAIPISLSFGGEGEPAPPEADNATALGNIDLGLLYTLNQSDHFALVFRGGVGLPTASSGRDEALTNTFASTPRYTDVALAIPEALYIRLAISPLFYSGRLFLRGDLGIDLGVNRDEGNAPELLRLNIGAGIDLDAVALSFELVNTALLRDNDSDDDFNNVFAFAARFMGETLQPIIAIGTPIDFRDRVKAFISVGIQAQFL